MTLQGMMSRPPIFESSSGSVTRGGEEEEHEFLCAEQTAKVSTPHSEGNELYGMISHLSNSSSQKYQNNGHKSGKLLEFTKIPLGSGTVELVVTNLRPTRKKYLIPGFLTAVSTERRNVPGNLLIC